MAIKLPTLTGRDGIARFVREGRILARLEHPNLVRVFDAGEESGRPYIVLEFVRGCTLSVVAAGRAVPAETATALVVQLLDGLGYAHASGVLHRDVKSENVLVTPSGEVKLADFGLARSAAESGGTQLGMVMGTPAYMSPEQAQGKPVDARTDVYSAGVVLFELVAGRRPFLAESMVDLLAQQIREMPPDLSKLAPKTPARLCEVVAQALAKNRDERFGSAAEFGERLKAALGNAQREKAFARLPEFVQQAGGGVLAVAGMTEIGRGGASIDAENRFPASGTRRPRASPSRPSSTVHRAAVAPQPGATAATAVSRLSIPLKAVLVVGLLACSMALAYWKFSKMEYAAMDVQVKVGARKAVVEWRSESEYIGKIAWGKEETSPRLAPLDSSALLKHVVTMEPLEPGKTYSFSIVFPDERRSLEYTFQTAAALIQPRDIDVLDGRLELAFDTPAPTVATLSAGGKTVRDPGPTTTHRLALFGGNLERDPVQLSFRDAGDENIQIERGGLVALFRNELVPAMVQELTRELDAFEIDRFLLRRIDQNLPPEVCQGAMVVLAAGPGFAGALKGERTALMPRYLRFPVGDPRALGLARVVREYVEKQPFHKLLKKLALIGRGLLDQRRMGVHQTGRLLAALSKLRDLDYYTNFLNIPFSVGIEGMFDKDFKVRRELGPTTAGALEQVIPGNGTWCHPFKEYQLVQTTQIDPGSIACTPPYDWKLALQNPAGWKRAELSLVDVRLETELYFKVTVNRTLVLTYRNDSSINAEAKSNRAPALAMTIDPRFLVNGENVIHVEITATPGTRYLGLKKMNTLKALRLSWE